jgi:poly(3-hydroxyalkanoate) synthetase
MPGGKPFADDWAGLLLPTLAAAEAGAQFMRRLSGAFAAQAAPTPEAAWASENEVVLELRAARLRRFGAGAGRPLLVCAPFSMHGAQIADLHPGHSLMQALRASGAPLYLVEWLSARADQRGRRIDDYLADLNVILDEIGGSADFVGICQGGWLGLVFAARFPGKLGRLALASAPIDIAAGKSALSALADATPLEAFRDLVDVGGGLVVGAQASRMWRPLPDTAKEIHRLLQGPGDCDESFLPCVEAFRVWSAHTIDLPGAYYLEVVENFYKNNALARGTFVALGKRLDLRALRNPIYLLAGRDDEIVVPAQTFACADLVGTPARHIARRLVDGEHLSLFMGARNLREVWPEVLAWLRPSPQRKRSQNA